MLGRPPGDVAAKARIGYLPENHRYPSHLTGEQVLHYFGRLSGMDSATRAHRVEEVLRRVRMEEWRRVRVSRYSKGMMQRLGMAQAILNEPDFLLLDEPTDGVDPIGRREIRDLLLEQRERGATVFLNSHLLSEIERVCDRVAILKDGRMVREGRVDDLTRARSGYEIIVRALKPEVVPALHAVVPDVTVVENRVEAATDEEGLNRLIDALRQRGVVITAVIPGRQSLEEVFVKVIGEEDP